MGFMWNLFSGITVQVNTPCLGVYRFSHRDKHTVTPLRNVFLTCSLAFSSIRTPSPPLSLTHHPSLYQGEDWIVPSSKLRLKNVRMEDGGDYTCMAKHPTLSSLKRSSTISITVLTGRWGVRG